jgi:hypothetical protein
MKKTQDISQIFRHMRVPASSKLDERVHREIDSAMTSPATTPSDAQPTLGQIIAWILKRQSTRYTIAASLMLAGLVALVLIHSTPSAWAMDQAIETLKKYRGLQLTGNIKPSDDKIFPFDLWLRANASGDAVESVLGKAGDEATLWTKDNQTYTYVRDDKAVYIEPGITEALNPWPGPKLLTQLATAKDYKAIEGDDPATGRRRVVVTCSAEATPSGPQSYLLEFDVQTKMLVSLKIWHNSRRDGTPYLDFQKILYFEDLADSTFDFQPPSGTVFTNQPLTIPDAGTSFPALSDPSYGISAEGMTRDQACQTILQQAWAANFKYDFARIRQLFPLAADSSDQSLREAIEQAGVVKLLKIGGIERTGSSKLGPLALIPSWVRAKDGTVTEVWMIVQFRETAQGTSCVIYGAHGYALNVKE